MSLTIKDLKQIQETFDKDHSIKGKEFYVDIGEENIHELEHLMVCLTGEIGEFCNILKKVVRGDLSLKDVKENLDEELIDCFVYLIKVSNQFNVDLENGFLKKVKKNKARFESI